MTLVKRSNNTFRCCIDYRRLNFQTIKDSYPLPLINSCFDALGGAEFYSVLDQSSSYWQVPLDERTAHKTAFLTRTGLYEFKVSPYGLCSLPVTFQVSKVDELGSCRTHLAGMFMFSG